MAQKKETGRSLTEMLGMLAIMGIITIAGVRMFNSAMNSHRANGLIYEANKRATTVAMQIATGNENLSVAEFKDPEGYTFGVEKNPTNTAQFNITLNGVHADVCQKMKNMVGEGTILRMISNNCTFLTFNNDLSQMSETQCTAAGKIWCGATGYCSDTASCCPNGNCSATQCPTGASTNGTRAGGKTGIYVNGTACICDNSTDVYTGGTACVPKPGSCSDWTKVECGFGYYCKFGYDADTNQIGNLDNSNQQCYQNLSGTCQSIQLKNFTETQRTILTNAGFRDSFVAAYGGLYTWWSAYNFCLSQGKHLIGVSDMECYSQGGDHLVQEGDYNNRTCCKRGQPCQSWASLWNGQVVAEGKESQVAKYSDKLVALKKIWGGTYFWLRSPYGNTSQNSCKAFYAYTHEGGYVFGRDRSNAYVAICE